MSRHNFTNNDIPKVLFVIATIVILGVTSHLRITNGSAHWILVWLSVIGSMGSVFTLTHLYRDYKMFCFRRRAKYD